MKPVVYNQQLNRWQIIFLGADKMSSKANISKIICLIAIERLFLLLNQTAFLMSIKSFESVECEHIPLEKNCRLCGIFLYPNTDTFKSNRFICTHEQSCKRYLRSLRKKISKEIPLKEKSEMPTAAFELLQRLAQKFQFGFETLALGVYLYNLLIHRPNSTYKDENAEFYSSVCLMVAAKAIELDRHIPYFSRYQKYGCQNFTKLDYEKAETEVIEEFEFNIQKPTFVTFINFYLSNGIVFSDEEYIHKKVFVLEEKVKQMCYQTLKSGSFIMENQQRLAGSILYDCRQEFGLGWHPAIEQYTGLTKQDIKRGSVSVLMPLQLHNFPIRRSSHSNYEGPNHKVTLPRIEKTDRDKTQSKTKDRLHFIRTAHSLRSVPSFHTLNIFGVRPPKQQNH